MPEVHSASEDALAPPTLANPPMSTNLSKTIGVDTPGTMANQWGSTVSYFHVFLLHVLSIRTGDTYRQDIRRNELPL